jgi:glycosyltransferase involved in cell wall biosynthesis
MELACTDHLKKVNAWLKPEFKKIKFSNEKFENEASVIIPVKNRAKTIKDAIKSVLSQETDFKFNLIIVDNYSSDGTTDIISSFAKTDTGSFIIPSQTRHRGCWNEGFHEKW